MVIDLIESIRRAIYLFIQYYESAKQVIKWCSFVRVNHLILLSVSTLIITSLDKRCLRRDGEHGNLWHGRRSLRGPNTDQSKQSTNKILSRKEKVMKFRRCHSPFISRGRLLSNRIGSLLMACWSPDMFPHSSRYFWFKECTVFIIANLVIIPRGF